MTVRTPPPQRSKADKLRALIDHPTTPEGEKHAAQNALDNLMAKGKADAAPPPSPPPHAPPDFDYMRDLFSRYARSGWPGPGFSFFEQARPYTEAPPRGEHDWTKDHARMLWVCDLCGETVDPQRPAREVEQLLRTRCGKSDQRQFMDGWQQGASGAPQRPNASEAYVSGHRFGLEARRSAEAVAGRWQPEPRAKAWRTDFNW